MPPTVQPEIRPPTAPAMNGAPPCGHFASLVRSVASLLARLPFESFAFFGAFPRLKHGSRIGASGGLRRRTETGSNSGQGTGLSGGEREHARTTGCVRRRRNGGGWRREGIPDPARRPVPADGWRRPGRTSRAGRERSETMDRSPANVPPRVVSPPQAERTDAKRPATRNGRARTQSSDCGAARYVSVAGLSRADVPLGRYGAHVDRQPRHTWSEGSPSRPPVPKPDGASCYRMSIVAFGRRSATSAASFAFAAAISASVLAP